MPTYRAAWILPIVAPPIRGGWVAVENGLITGVGADAPRGSVDLGAAAVLPALVNTHTHLELSYLRGRVGRAHSFLDWIRTCRLGQARVPGSARPHDSRRRPVGHRRSASERHRTDRRRQQHARYSLVASGSWDARPALLRAARIQCARSSRAGCHGVRYCRCGATGRSCCADQSGPPRAVLRFACDVCRDP